MRYILGVRPNTEVIGRPLNIDRLLSQVKKIYIGCSRRSSHPASSTGFPRALWGTRTSERRESWRQARSAGEWYERVQRVPPLSLIINSNIPQKGAASDWGRSSSSVTHLVEILFLSWQRQVDHTLVYLFSLFTLEGGFPFSLNKKKRWSADL